MTQRCNRTCRWLVRGFGRDAGRKVLSADIWRWIIDLNELLEALAARTEEKIGTEPRVVLKDVDTFKLEDLEIGPVWHRLSDIVAVVFDLKSSTNLEKGRTSEGTASIYDAGVGGVVRTLSDFGAEFVDIQGDGGFGLFWGPTAYLQAVCAAITIHTFSADFTEQIGAKWSEVPSTGFKVGVASGPVMVKRVGLERHLELQEPVWVGRPVNYAAKAAQQTAPDKIFVTGSIWDQISENDFLAFSCGCHNETPKASPPSLLWSSVVIDHIPDGQRQGLSLGSYWCTVHGEEFCNAILSGATHRSDIPQAARTERDALGAKEDIRKAFQERSEDRQRRLDELFALRKSAR